MEKIEVGSDVLYKSNTIEMKPVYSTNEELKCGVVAYGDKKYYMDYKDKDKLLNSSKKFVFLTENDTYPSYCYNYKRFDLLDFIFLHNREMICYVFDNKNVYDLRRHNVKFYHRYHTTMIEKYNVIEYIDGHMKTTGATANIMKNPIWKITENDKEYLLMYCENDIICKLCDKSYAKIIEYEQLNNIKITWYYNANGYIQGHIPKSQLVYYIHQIIMDCYGNGKGTKNISVDHIDQNPLNNAMENLRVATRKEQEQNCNGIKDGTKRERKHSAKPLPEGITQQMMAKYVVYYHEYLNAEKTKDREYFKVERHPKLDNKAWIGSKSSKLTVHEKLEQANKVVTDLENGIYPCKNESEILPKYFSVVLTREKPHMVFERRVDGKRMGLKMVLPTDYDLHDQIEVMSEKIKAKYGEDAVV